MTIRVSSTSFVRYLAAQSTTRIAKVREAKRIMLASHEEYRRLDYWLTIREASVALLTGTINARQFDAKVASVHDSKKIANYRTAAAGLKQWIGRKSMNATPLQAQTWASSGLEVSVTPEVAVSWPGSSTFVLKLYFGAPLSKYSANPLLRLIELSHGSRGVAAVLDVHRSRLHAGPTARPADLDILLKTESASYVAIWNSI